MIFVTVGTHEQQFNRLVECVDRLKGDGIITEDVVIQTGFSTYEPKHCTYKNLFPFDKMEDYVAKARIIITHGGPSSFIMPLQYGKTPIVVPRRVEFDEHVNNHQLEFCKAVSKRMGTIVVVEDIEKLKDVILDYDSIISSISSDIQTNNRKFNENFAKVVDDLFKDKRH